MTDDIANGRPDAEHPVMTAMNEMGYDAMTLGNHEFNWGTEVLKKIISQAKFPVLAENVLNKDGSYYTGAGWTIAERGGVKLAIIGYIREGLLPTPYNKSYNLADYNELVAEAEANRAAKGTDEMQKNDP